MRGLVVVIIVVVALCFTGLGSKMMVNLEGLENIGSGCYSALERMGGQAATPICDALAHGVATLSDALHGIGDKFSSWKESLLGTGPDISATNFSIGDRLSRLASSRDALAQMMQSGPSSISGVGSSIQQAIDSFTIGQGLIKQGSDSSNSQALQWFQQGAQQPQGYGVLSQLELGNLYMTGQGVPQNNDKAVDYLTQANSSITTLMGSNSPQSQQLLNTLPGSPTQIKAQLDNAIRQLQMKK